MHLRTEHIKMSKVNKELIRSAAWIMAYGRVVMAQVKLVAGTSFSNNMAGYLITGFSICCTAWSNVRSWPGP